MARIRPAYAPKGLFDGKTLRGSFDNFADTTAAHLVSGFAAVTALVLGHLEIPAVQRLLGELGLPRAWSPSMRCIVKKPSNGPLKGTATSSPGEGQPTDPSRRRAMAM